MSTGNPIGRATLAICLGGACQGAPAWEHEDSLWIGDLACDAQRPYLGINAIVTPDDALAGLDVTWHVSLVVEVDNTATDSGFLSLWLLDAAWDGISPPPQVAPDAYRTISAALDETPQRTRAVYDLEWETGPGELHLLLALDGEADVQGTAELVVTATSDEALPEGTGFTVVFDR